MWSVDTERFVGVMSSYHQSLPYMLKKNFSAALDDSNHFVDEPIGNYLTQVRRFNSFVPETLIGMIIKSIWFFWIPFVLVWKTAGILFKICIWLCIFPFWLLYAVLISIVTKPKEKISTT